MAIAAVLLLPAAAAPRAQNHHYGIVSQILSEQHATRIAELGAGSVRLDFNWYEIEPHRGVFQWEGVDERVREARRGGLRVYATLAYTPGWAGPARNRPPRDLSHWHDFVRECMRRYGSDVVYGVWNEPNIDTFLEDDDAGSRYKDLWREAHNARLVVNQRYALGGPETSHHAIGRYFKNVMRYMVGTGKMYAHDKVTVHWYPDGPRLGRYMARVRRMAQGREVWLTETGASTCEHDPRAQVTRHRRVLDEFVERGRSWWTTVFLYVLHTDDPCSEAIIAPDWSPRPAFDHYREFIRANP